MALLIETTFDYTAKDYSLIMSYRNNMNNALGRIRQIGESMNGNIISKFNIENSVCFIFADSREDTFRICDAIDEFLRYYFHYSELNVYAGYSGFHSGVESAVHAVDESRNAIKFAKMSDDMKTSFHYEEMGILGFIVNSNSRDELFEYCNRVLGKLIESDKEAMTEYLVTVKTYLENNNNMALTAKKLFIHRNTLINRIKKIEEITGKSLSDSDVKLEYMCCFKILEFIAD